MFQDVANYPTLGATTGFGIPFLTQQTGFQGTGNPYGGAQGIGQHPYAGMGGIPGYGAIHPQQLQLAAMMAAQQGIPPLATLAQVAGLTQNPLIQAILQNPLLAHLYAGGLYGQQLQGGIGYGGTGNPLGQQGNPWGQPLAPQTWVGQGGQMGQQIHPLLAQQIAARQLGVLGLPGIGLPGFGLGY